MQKKTCVRRRDEYNSPASTQHLKAGLRNKQKSGCSSVVERNLAKVDVVGSNPIIRSHKNTRM